MLIILSGLPGVGKTTIAREVARQTGAVHVRIDSIEQAILDSDEFKGPMNDAGYRVGYAVALDNLQVGRTVIADSVNPLAITRKAWIEVANRANVRAIEVEVICSNAEEHKRRVHTRPADVPALKALTWLDVVSRNYEPWNHEHIVLDTALRTVEQAAKIIRESLLGE